VLASQEVRLDCRALCAREVRELSGYSRRPVRPVSVLQKGFASPTVPRTFRVGFILSCLIPSSEFLRCTSLSRLSERRVLPGFWPSSRHHRRHPRLRERTLSRSVPPSGFRNLSTACSASGFAGLLHPAATSRVSVQGFLPIRSRPDLSPGDAPLPLASDYLPARRLPQPAASASRLCSADRSVPESLWLTSSQVAPLFGVRSSFRLRRTHRGPGSPVPPLVAFAFEVFILAETKMLAPRARLQRVNDGLADVSVSGIIRLFEVPGLPSTASFLGEAHTRGRDPLTPCGVRMAVCFCGPHPAG
jgi:hypothetical protein